MTAPATERLDPERAAYWYFRLNGFLQIENSVVHPANRGGQLTDADLLGVRFRHRAERAFDPSPPMEDDPRLDLGRRYDDVVIVEVKTGVCALNGPWTTPERENVHRVLAAIGCISRADIRDAADCIYEEGIVVFGRTRIRLVAVGRERDERLAQRYHNVPQLTWDEVTGFIWDRFDAYRRQKRDVDQWASDGKHLKFLADRRDRESFVAEVARLM